MAFLRADVLSLRRSGFAAAAIGSALVWAGMLLLAPPIARAAAAPYVLFFDVALLGFYLMAAIIFAERESGVLRAFAASPARLGERFAVAAALLTAMGALAALALLAAGTELRAGWWLALFGVGTLSVLAVGLATLAAIRHVDLVAFLLPSQLYALALYAPALLELADLGGPWMLALPSGGAHALIFAGAAGVGAEGAAWSSAWSSAHLGAAVVLSALWAAVFAWGAVRALDRAARGGAPAVGATAPPKPDLAAPRALSTTRRPSRLAALLAADLKNTRRDALAPWLIIAPLLLIAVLRWGAPPAIMVLEARFDADLAPYIPAFLSFMGPVNAALMFGLVAGLPLVEERERGLAAAWAATPARGGLRPMTRAAAAATATFLTVAAGLPLSGLAPGAGAAGVFAASLAAASLAPVATLTVAALARDRLAAVALSKVFGAVGLAAVVATLAPAPLAWIAAPLPPFAPSLTLQAAMAEGGTTSALWGWAAFSVALNLAVAAAMLRRLSRGGAV